MSSVLGATPLGLALDQLGLPVWYQAGYPTVGANRHLRRKSIHCCSEADLLVLHSFFSLESQAISQC